MEHTKRNTEHATHAATTTYDGPGDLRFYRIKNGHTEFLNDNQWIKSINKGSIVLGWDSTIELSRPVGQRKEDLEHHEQAHHIALQIEALGPIGSPVEFVEDVNDIPEIIAGKREVKPIFTQAMYDAGQPPEVGMNYHDGEVIKGPDSSGMWIGEEQGEWVIMSLESIKPIDIRTDEEKAIEHIMKYHDMSKSDAEDFLTDIKVGKINGVKWMYNQ